jgi:hypothetical protein
MSEVIDDITINFEEDDKLVVKELDKVVLSKGAWTTILFKYQELNRQDDSYGDDKYSIRRYQKRSGYYQQKSKFNISSKAQAQKIVETLQGWIAD